MNDSDYQQPNFYRFNQDSIKLVNRVKDSIAASSAILDIGAGCGVIGLELARVFHPSRLFLLEMQSEYKEYLIDNVARFCPKGTTAEIVISSFQDFCYPEQFDLIVCNPPYYLPGSGKPSPDVRRARARLFLEGDWSSLLQFIQRSLLPQGRAFLVVKNEKMILKEIKINWNDRMTLSHQDDLIFLEISGLDIN
jgi:tRNA1Val (adenine37-N6)-methyltransferase